MNLIQQLDKDIQEQLRAPFPEEAYTEITFPDGNKGKALGRQWIIDRLNEVFGIGGWSVQSNKFKIREQKGEAVEVYGDGYIEVSSGLIKFWTDRCYGGCLLQPGMSIADGFKVTETNILTRSAALLGIGGDAYKSEVITYPEASEELDQEDEQRATYTPAPEMGAFESGSPLGEADGEAMVAPKEAPAMEEESTPQDLRVLQVKILEGTDQKAVLQAIEDLHGLTKEQIMLLTDRKRLKVSFLQEWYRKYIMPNVPLKLDTGYALNMDSWPIVQMEELTPGEQEPDPGPQNPTDPLPPDSPDKDIFPHDLPDTPLPKEPKEHMSGDGNYEPREKAIGNELALDIYNKLWKVWKDVDDTNVKDIFAELEGIDANYPKYLSPDSLENTLNNIAKFGPDELIEQLLKVK